MTEDTTEALAGAIRVDERQLRGHIDEAVRSSVEETLNGLLEAEADVICGAGRYERSADRLDTRAGYYERKLETKAGEDRLKVQKLRSHRSSDSCVPIVAVHHGAPAPALFEAWLAGAGMVFPTVAGISVRSRVIGARG